MTKRLLSQEEINSCLIQAAADGKLQFARLAITAGADVNARSNSDESTALHHAAHGNHADIVQLLLDNGADVNVVDCRKRTTPRNASAVLGHDNITKMLDEAAKQQGHAGRVSKERSNRQEADQDAHRQAIEAVAKALASRALTPEQIINFYLDSKKVILAEPDQGRGRNDKGPPQVGG